LEKELRGKGQASGCSGVGFKSLADSWADTTTPHGRLLVTMLAGIAEFERELIRARTGEGRNRAKARGVRFGRPPVLSVHQRQEVIQRLVEGTTQADLARNLWREPSHDIEAAAKPFRGRKRQRRVKRQAIPTKRPEKKRRV
jgi:DNA invertase Pin-like site-specific DNA recombinase